MDEVTVEKLAQTVAGVLGIKVNIIPGWVEPADMEEIKRLVDKIGVKSILFPDTSGVLNAPLSGEYKMFPEGGTTVKELQSTGDSIGTLAFGEWCSADAARWLDSTHKVPCSILDMPEANNLIMDLNSTDKLILHWCSILDERYYLITVCPQEHEALGEIEQAANRIVKELSA